MSRQDSKQAMAILAFPSGNRAMPSVRQLEQLITLPLTQLIVCGRSGSMVLHALLDGHPEILHIPHTFKFYDFLAVNSDFSAMDGIALAQAFVAHNAHEALFDSDRSVLLRGRLGPQMNARVIIDKAAFAAAMAALLPGSGHDGRRIFCAALLAHAWCLDTPLDTLRHLFMHLHHGDWLWPEALEETCNLQGHSNSKGLAWLTPQRIVISLRNPADTIRSITQFVLKAVDDPAAQSLWMERYLRHLIQDWHRLALVSAAGIDFRVVRLEDLRENTSRQLTHLTEWMGIGQLPTHLLTPTMFRLPWWGDTYSEPLLAVTSPEPISPPSPLNQDHRFFYGAAQDLVAAQGYPVLGRLWSSPLIFKWLTSAPERPWPVTAQILAERISFNDSLRLRHAQALANARYFLAANMEGQRNGVAML